MFALFTLPEPLDRALSAVFSWLNEIGLGELLGAKDLTSYKGLALGGDPVVLAVLLVLALCALGVGWALLLIVARGLIDLFGGGREPAPARHDYSSMMTMQSAEPVSGLPAQARLDGGVNRTQRAAATEPRRSMALLAAPLAAPSDDAPATGSRLAAAVGRPAAFGRELGVLPPSRASKALPFREIALSQKPLLAPTGQLVAARPEWKGRATPTSLKEAGAVEQCHIATREAGAESSAESVRERDFRLFSLPRVDAAGRKRPDLTVFTVSDHGFVPRGTWPSPKRIKRDRD